MADDLAPNGYSVTFDTDNDTEDGPTEDNSADVDATEDMVTDDTTKSQENQIKMDSAVNLVGNFNEPIRLHDVFELPINFINSAGESVTEHGLTEDDFDVKIATDEAKFKLEEKKLKMNENKIVELIVKVIILSTKERFKWTSSDKELCKYIKLNVDIKYREVVLPKLSLNLSVKVGKPNIIMVFPSKDEGDIEIENGSLPLIGVKVLDKCYNLVTCDIEPKLSNGIIVEFYEPSSSKLISSHVLDFNTGPDGTLMNMKGSKILKFNNLTEKDVKKEVKAKIYLKEFKNVKPIERVVIVKASCKPASMKLFYEADIDTIDTVDTSTKKKEVITSELRNNEEVEWIAGSMMKGITYQLYDEDNQLMKKATIRSNDMKISWRSAEWIESTGWKVHHLNEGKLPDIRSPRVAGQILSCSVTFFTSDKFRGSEFTFNFTIKSIPGPPSLIQLNVINTRCGSMSSLKLHAGQVMDSNIYVNCKLVDKWNNGCNMINDDDVNLLKINCKSGKLVQDVIKMVKGDDDGEIHVSNIQINGSLGTHSIDFNYKQITSSLSVELIHGIPSKLIWLLDEGINPIKSDASNESTITMVKETKIGGIKLQLVDEFDNKCLLEGIKVTLGTSPKILLKDGSEHIVGKNQFTDCNGVANYGLIIVAVKDDVIAEECTSTVKPCPGLCYGSLPVQAKAEIVEDADSAEEQEDNSNRIKTIHSEKLIFHVKCDSTTPIDFFIDCESIDYENKKLTHHIIAGSKLPIFNVSTIAEDGQSVLGLGPSGIFMETMCIGVPESRTPLLATGFNEETGIYVFDLLSPRMPGNFILKFGFQEIGSTQPFYSDSFLFKVTPDKPFKFEPLVHITEPWVSNTSDVATRTIVSNVTFVLTDKFNNPIVNPNSIASGEGDMEVDDKYSGQLTVQILGLNTNEPIDTLPKFTNNVGFKSFPITNGTCLINSLELMENSPGIDGKRYKILFNPTFNEPVLIKTKKLITKDGAEDGKLEEEVIKEEPIKSFQLTFGFVNDVAKQDKMKRLTGRRMELKHKLINIKQTRELIVKQIEEFKKQIDTLNEKFIDTLTKNRSIIDERIKNDSTLDHELIRSIIRSKSADLEDAREEGAPSINDSDESNKKVDKKVDEFANDPNVIGRIVNLIKVESIESSRVLSWHIRGDLQTIVTRTSNKARELDKLLNGKQQVWPIDGVSKKFKEFQQNSIQFPHLKATQPDNSLDTYPRWALSFVTFNEETEEVARIVFNSLLGNILVMDTIDDAIKYRLSCNNQGIDVGTILTLKDGRRLTSTGKFGGLNNAAPPLDDPSFKRFGLFSLSPTHQEVRLQKEINILTELESLAITKEERCRQLANFKKAKHVDLDLMNRDQARYDREIIAIDEQINKFSGSTSTTTTTTTLPSYTPQAPSPADPRLAINGQKRSAAFDESSESLDDEDNGPSDVRRARLE